MAEKKDRTIFEQLLAIDTSKHVEQKGRYSYLSWCWAIAELRKASPTARWDVVRFPMAASPHVMLPYLDTPAGCFVEVQVTVDGVTLSQVHPVLSDNNKTIEKPNAFDINRSIQRALVKAIALHGLGLNVYAGEDLPLGDDGEAEAIAELGKAISAHLDRLGLKDKARSAAVLAVLKRAPESLDDHKRVVAALAAKAEPAAQANGHTETAKQ